MSTFADVVAEMKARAAAQITMLPVRWDKDTREPLPDEPAPFVFFTIETDGGRYAAFGGGRGANEQHVDGELVGLVHIPRDWGLEEHATYGEHVAAAFRSYRGEHVSCGAVAPQPAIDGSNLKPPGMESEVENYACVLVAVPFFYRQIG